MFTFSLFFVDALVALGKLKIIIHTSDLCVCIGRAFSESLSAPQFVDK